MLFFYSSHTMWDSYFETSSSALNSRATLYSSHTMWDSYFETRPFKTSGYASLNSSHTMWDSYFETLYTICNGIELLYIHPTLCGIVILRHLLPLHKVVTVNYLIHPTLCGIVILRLLCNILHLLSRIIHPTLCGIDSTVFLFLV